MKHLSSASVHRGYDVPSETTVFITSISSKSLAEELHAYRRKINGLSLRTISQFMFVFDESKHEQDNLNSLIQINI